MRPDYLKSGDSARLFPVLSNSSKEGRATAILLATLRYVEPFRREMLATIGAKSYQKASVDAYTEVVFEKQGDVTRTRPDGLFIVKRGKTVWRCLVEAKIGNAQIDSDQIDDYRRIAQANGIDCIISISNQLTSDPKTHPEQKVRSSKLKKVPVFHWSWTFIRTRAELLLKSEEWDSTAQRNLLSEFLRFLNHESTGVKGFERMPPPWSDLIRSVAAGGALKRSSVEVEQIVNGWHQETRELSLILSRRTESIVDLKLERGHLLNAKERVSSDISKLCDEAILETTLIVPDAAAPISVTANILAKSISVSMSVSAPQDKATSKGRINWLLRQIKSENVEHLHIQLRWKNKRNHTQASFQSFKDGTAESEMIDGELRSMTLVWSEYLGGTFGQRTKFIEAIERIVPTFYGEVAQFIVPWRPHAPKLKEDGSEVTGIETKSDDKEIEF